MSHHSAVSVPGFGDVNGSYGTVPANWSADAIAYFRDSNHVSIIESMMYYINGTMIAMIHPLWNTSRISPSTDTDIIYDAVWSQ